MRLSSAVQLVCLACLGCAREEAPPSAVALPMPVETTEAPVAADAGSVLGVVERFPLHSHVRITETRTFPDGSTKTTDLDETWESLGEKGGFHVYRITSVGRPTGPEVWEMFYGREGVGFYGGKDKDTGEMVTYVPPEYIVRSHPVVGQTWGESHALGQTPVATSRRCSVVPPERCSAGVTVACETMLVVGAVVRRRFHYCDGAGYVGEDTDVLRDGELRSHAVDVVKVAE